MKKQVVAILGGKKNGNTHRLLKYIEKKLREHDIDLNILVLKDFNLQECRGCETCVFGKGCVIQDDMSLLQEALEKSDGIIIASPVYNNNVSGKMKSFIDKTVKWSHSPILTSKPYLGVTTTSSSGLNIVLKFLTIAGVNWGAHPIGNVWASKRSLHMKKNNKIISKFIECIKDNPQKHRPTTYQIIQFQIKKTLAQTVFPNDYKHWESHGWLHSVYYYPCRINIFKKMFGILFYRFFLEIMKKSAEKYADTVGTQNYGKLIFE